MAKIEGSVEFEKRGHNNAYTVFVIMFLSIGSMSYGYSAAVIGTTLGQPSFYEYMGLNDNPQADSLIGAMNALFYSGGVVGSFCCGWLSNAYGRKFSVIVGCLLVLLSGALLTGSVNPAMFIVFRFFNGWGSFQLLATVPLWVAEIVPPKSRGVLVDLVTLIMNFGYVFAGYTGLGFYFCSGTEQWRGPMGLQMVGPVIVLSGIYWMPESPRYLLSKGQDDRARAIVNRLHSDPRDPTNSFAEREFYQMRKQIEFDRTLKTSYVEIFRKPSYRRRALITMFLTFSLMSSGILVINNYGALLYSGLGYDPTRTLLFTTGWTLTSFVFNGVAMLFVDRLKRNWLISAGFFCCLLCLIVEAALQYNFLGTSIESGLAGGVAGLYLYAVSYALFLDGPTYFYIAELWPSHLRAQGFALGIGTLCATCIVWLQAAPTGFAKIGWKFYIFFMFFAALGGIVTLLFFPDTLHKPLEEIAALFGDDDTVQVFQKDLDVSGLLDTAKTNPITEKNASEVGQSTFHEEVKSPA